MSCFICQKHAGSDEPPGGYIVDDEYWRVCHFPAEQSVIGQLVIESKRHILDFSDMTEEEAGAYGLLVKKLYAAIKMLTGAERVYSLVTLDGVPHFHAHLIPRDRESATKGVKYIAEKRSCDALKAAEAARKLRAWIGESAPWE